MKLIIQIPCFNEEETLQATYDALPKKIDGIDEIETLIIDDGSTDKTIEKARDLGIDYIVRFRRNKGLAYGFRAGLDACLRMNADIIVNTDADNQYRADDIEKLIKPILNEEADEVIGERPIDEIEDFSPLKKKFQHLGSWVVRKASGTGIQDAPSGFRAFSREAAMRINVINDYTYTLETIIQAGRNRYAIEGVPIHTNPQTRKSRLFKSIWSYMRKSGSVIIRSTLMYSPLAFFGGFSLVFLIIGVIIGIRFLILGGIGHIQSLILCAVFILIGTQTLFLALQGDIIAANRRLLEDIQVRVRRLEIKNGDLPDDLIIVRQEENTEDA